MAEYSLFFRKSVERDLAQIPKRDVVRIMERILTLASLSLWGWINSLDSISFGRPEYRASWTIQIKCAGISGS
jgi:hypothetical protein